MIKYLSYLLAGAGAGAGALLHAGPAMLLTLLMLVTPPPPVFHQPMVWRENTVAALRQDKIKPVWI